MPRSISVAHKPVHPKRHESRNQELRQERVGEARRLDGLKKALEIKVQAGSRETQAA
jgi:hypothetical protein